MCSCLSLFVPCRVREGKVLHDCWIARYQLSKCHLACCQGLLELSQKLNAWARRVLGAKGSGLTLPPTAVSVFTADLFIFKLPIYCVGCTFYLWMNSVVMKNYWVYTLDFVTTIPNFMWSAVYICDQNFGFSSGIQQISAC